MKYKIGVIIVLLSYLAALNPYLTLYAIPFFLVGAALVWLSRKKILTRAAWTITPLILWYPGVQIIIRLFLLTSEMTEPQYDFIFPHKFSGSAIIIEDMPCAQAAEKNNGRITLEFPANGILLYKKRLESGLIDDRYFIKDSANNLIELANYNYFAKDSSQNKRKGIKVGFSAVSDVYIPERQIFAYQVLYVGLKDSIEALEGSGVSLLLINKAEKLVKDCISEDE